MARPIASTDVRGGPYQGTHTRGNWESDNAVDIYSPYGSPVYAVTFGRIGPASQYGPLNSTEPALAGLRLHLRSDTGNQEFYYAHLSKIVVQPDSRVKAGQLIGYSGAANGVNHLHFAVRVGEPYAYLSGKAQRPKAAQPEPAAPAAAAPEEPTVAPEPATPAPPPVIPPALEPPPGIAMPGSVPFTLNRQQINQTWQTLAQTAPFQSPYADQFAYLSGLGLNT